MTEPTAPHPPTPDSNPNPAPAAAPPPPMDYDGERMVPERAPARIFHEHLARYRFAAPFAPGRRVLDIACGEGYGAAALLRAGAVSVVAVDLSPEACDHARRKYGLDARVGDARAIPLPDASIDLVVSFETLEHVPEPARFLDECVRVLAPGGLLVVSTPNRPVYSDDGRANPFHHREFDETELLDALELRFRRVRLFSQAPRRARFWHPRALVAERSPWARLRGFWRLRSLFCPAIRADIPDALRANPVAAILAPEPLLGRWADPHRVRPRSPLSGEEPWYWIAVASDPVKFEPNLNPLQTPSAV